MMVLYLLRKSGGPFYIVTRVGWVFIDRKSDEIYHTSQPKETPPSASVASEGWEINQNRQKKYKIKTIPCLSFFFGQQRPTVPDYFHDLMTVAVDAALSSFKARQDFVVVRCSPFWMG